MSTSAGTRDLLSMSFFEFGGSFVRASRHQQQRILSRSVEQVDAAAAVIAVIEAGVVAQAEGSGLARRLPREVVIGLFVADMKRHGGLQNRRSCAAQRGGTPFERVVPYFEHEEGHHEEQQRGRGSEQEFAFHGKFVFNRFVRGPAVVSPPRCRRPASRPAPSPASSRSAPWCNTNTPRATLRWRRRRIVRLRG